MGVASIPLEFVKSLFHMDSSESEGEIAAPTAKDSFDMMKSKRICQTTVDAYKSKLRIMGRYFAANGGLADDDGLPQLPLDQGLTIAFFGALVQPRSVDTIDSVFGPPSKHLIARGGHISSSHAGGYKSALAWLHSEANEEIDPSLNKDLNNFISGYKKAVADYKQTGEMPAFEGKHALSFAGYMMLASRFFHIHPTAISTWDMGIFAWTFLLLQWNLIARFSRYSSHKTDQIVLDP